MKIDKIPAISRPKYTTPHQVEFAHAAHTGYALRTALGDVLKNASDSYLSGRLTGAMMHILQTDKINPFGYRNVAYGSLKRLKGFEFNVNARRQSINNQFYRAALDRTAGHLAISIPVFDHCFRVNKPRGANDFKIITIGVETGFESSKFVVDVQRTSLLSKDFYPGMDICHWHKFTPGTRKPVLLLLGIEFYEVSKGSIHQVYRKNSLVISEVYEELVQ